jgi:PAS domain S-box-containing protein
MPPLTLPVQPGQPKPQPVDEVLEKLNKLSIDVALSGDIDEYLTKAIEIAGIALNVTSAYYVLYDLDGGVEIVIAEYFSEFANEKELESDLNIPYSFENNFGDPTEWEDTGYFVQHIDDPDLREVEREHLLEYGGKSSIGLPVLGKEGLLGCLELWESRQVRHFTQEEINLLQTIANNIGHNVTITQLFQELQQRNAILQTLNQISAEVALSMETESVLTSIVEATVKALGMTSGYIGDWNPVEKTSTIRAEYFGEKASVAERVSDLGEVYNLGLDLGDAYSWIEQPNHYYIQHIDDPNLDPLDRKHMIQYGAKSTIGASIVTQEKTIGYIELWESRQKRKFSEKDIELLQAIANQVGQNILNAQLFEALSQSQVRFQQLSEATFEGVAIHRQGMILDVNASLCDMFGMSEATMLSLNLTELFHESACDILQEQFKNPSVLPIEIEGKTATGELFFAEVVSRFLTETTQVTAIRNITVRKTAEAALTTAKAELEASRLKNEFMAVINHELRTPVSAILALADMLNMGVGKVESAKFVDSIIQQAETMQTLVEQLLDQAKLEAGQMKAEIAPFAVVDLIRDLEMTMEKRVLDKGLALQFVVGAEMPAILLSDRWHLNRILTNLIGNAIKFTDTGEILVEFCREGSTHWTIRVCDTGSGIRAEEKEEVFQSFNQGKRFEPTRHHGGIGLGLSIVKRLTELLNGSMILESVVGRGSIFSLTFPNNQVVKV